MIAAVVPAREEANCRRSYFGYDRQYLDEEALGRIAASEGAAPVPPFNLGVVLFNNGSWRRIAGLERLRAGRPEKSLLMTGLRGVGKTVLLSTFEGIAEDAGFRTAVEDEHRAVG